MTSNIDGLDDADALWPGMPDELERARNRLTTAVDSLSAFDRAQGGRRRRGRVGLLREMAGALEKYLAQMEGSSSSEDA